MERAKMQAVVAYMNIYRAIHNATPLVLSSELNEVAGNWSRALGKRCAHSPYPYGENIACFGGDPILAVDMFYGERNTFGGHFTQLVWKASRRVGIAMSEWNIVFEFDPAGNGGNYLDNVGPPFGPNIHLPRAPVG